MHYTGFEQVDHNLKYSAAEFAEFATPKPDGNLTRLSPPCVRVWPARLNSGRRTRNTYHVIYSVT